MTDEKVFVYGISNNPGFFVTDEKNSILFPLYLEGVECMKYEQGRKPITILPIPLRTRILLDPGYCGTFDMMDVAKVIARGTLGYNNFRKIVAEKGTKIELEDLLKSAIDVSKLSIEDLLREGFH